MIFHHVLLLNLPPGTIAQILVFSGILSQGIFVMDQVLKRTAKSQEDSYILNITTRCIVPRKEQRSPLPLNKEIRESYKF